MKDWLIKIGVILAVAAVGGFLVVVSGIVPIKASSGHWAITAWFLHFSMQRSVSTHSIGIQVPVSLDEPKLVLKGAGHFETGCSPCHGRPQQHHPEIPQQMTPHPPYLPPRISEWEPQELFYIVKHGVKFTGMPAFPSQKRDDEVWAMVAFLLELPELDEAGYRRLVYGEETEDPRPAALTDLGGSEDLPTALVQTCARCHGREGLGRGLGAFPKLAGQHYEYLAASLAAYASGQRHSGIMEPVAASLSREELDKLARYYSNLPATSPWLSNAETASAIEQRGKAIAHFGIPKQRVPACVDCHGPGDTKRNPRFPILAGQYADYLVLQLELFKERDRGGTDYAHLMHPVAGRLTPEQMRDVARYFESLSPVANSVEP
jgi:cytochrome c553